MATIIQSFPFRAILTLRNAARALLGIVSAFWAWFVCAVGFSEGLAVAGPHMLKFLVPIVVLNALAWFLPRVAGVALLIAALFAAWYFHNVYTFWMMPVPCALAAAGLLMDHDQRNPR